MQEHDVDSSAAVRIDELGEVNKGHHQGLLSIDMSVHNFHR